MRRPGEQCSESVAVAEPEFLTWGGQTELYDGVGWGGVSAAIQNCTTGVGWGGGTEVFNIKLPP